MQVGALEVAAAVLAIAPLAGPNSAAILQECRTLSLEGVYSGVGQAEAEEASPANEVRVSVVEEAGA